MMDNYYVRAINPLNWDSSPKEEYLFGDAICSDWDCSNSDASNQWSLFEILSTKHFTKSESLDLVALFLLFSNFNKFSEGVSFLFIESSFFDHFNQTVDEDLFNKLKIKHVNVNGVLYKDIKRAVSHTLKTLTTNLITYEKSDLAFLIKKYFETETEVKKSYENHCYYFFKRKIRTMYEKFNSSFFPDNHIVLSTC